MTLAPPAALPDTKRMEDLSLAYIRAVVAQAGFIVDPMASDWDSRDGTFHATGGKRP